MDPLVERVLARYKLAKAVVSRHKVSFDDRLLFDWGEVLKEVQGFSKYLAKAKDAPSTTAALKVYLKKTMQFTLWTKQCTSRYAEGIALGRRANVALKGAGEREMLALLADIKSHMQQALDSVAPERFTYHGFTVTNRHHVEEGLCLKALEGVDLLKAIFKKRDVEKLLSSGLDCINLDVVGGAPGSAAFYGSDKGADVPEITLYAGPHARGSVDAEGLSHFIHEFGHHVYYRYLSPEARAAWDEPWEAQEGVERLQIPTEYGKKNKFEDFAETFAVFMSKPEKLTPVSKYRMQRTLSLSGFYGKPVMRLAGTGGPAPV